ncbi:hypothetical protein Ancab_007066 [Ancistrocladus abbreviatus]
MSCTLSLSFNFLMSHSMSIDFLIAFNTIVRMKKRREKKKNHRLCFLLLAIRQIVIWLCLAIMKWKNSTPNPTQTIEVIVDFHIAKAEEDVGYHTGCVGLIYKIGRPKSRRKIL